MAWAGVEAEEEQSAARVLAKTSVEEPAVAPVRGKELELLVVNAGLQQTQAHF